MVTGFLAVALLCFCHSIQFVFPLFPYDQNRIIHFYEVWRLCEITKGGTATVLIGYIFLVSVFCEHYLFSLKFESNFLLVLITNSIQWNTFKILLSNIEVIDCLSGWIDRNYCFWTELWLKTTLSPIKQHRTNNPAYSIIRKSEITGIKLPEVVLWPGLHWCTPICT